jgi:hypothetical protein
MLDRKETKMLSTQRKSTGPLAGIVSVACQLSLPQPAHFPPLPTVGRLRNPRATSSSQFRSGTGTQQAGTLGILDTPLQARCLSPVTASPMTVVICRAPAVRIIWPTK